MSPRRVRAVARRIVEGFRRDRRTLGLVFVVPVVITALLGWVIRDQAPTTTRIVVADEAGALGASFSASLATVAGSLTGPGSVTVSVTAVGSEAAARTAVKNGGADVAIVLPADLGSIATGGKPTITVVTEGTDPAADAARAAVVQRLLSVAFATVASGGPTRLPAIRRETVYLSPDADALDVLAPVFLGYFAYFFVFILTGISFLRERVGGTLERLLATPVTRAEIVVGYLIGFGIFATLQVGVLTAFVLGRIDMPAIGPFGGFGIGLGVASAGSPFLTFLVALLLALGAVCLGIFISTFARTELQVIQFIPVVIVPQGLLGGIFWPVDRLPDLLRPVAHVLPVTYAVDGLREVMLKGADLGSSALRLDLVVLALVAVVFVLLAATTIKREVV